MADTAAQDRLYAQMEQDLGPALARLARGYEADAHRCGDLLQDIRVALWRSFAAFDGRCSLRTWTYRVAHNTATSYVLKRRRDTRDLTTLEALAEARAADDPEAETGHRRALERLLALIQDLKPADRQIAMLYLEDLDAAAIGEVTGISPGAVAVKIHRLKALLARQFHARRPA